ncbi:hypothetical protein RFI_05564 [Reticulomyxa filosa]|uniref:Uncharacterized protein n=1 Tax=Reticulomyxa filosa TaxID=46433 RepID=X6P1X4_RETFI|nr:hypothetical protein RFI_05564 [Reticulomyxa filosa]|eukprot:ETO31557.1 hypothetical protein RFI_05564 [Reticulomyxa filosa]
MKETLDCFVAQFQPKKKNQNWEIKTFEINGETFERAHEWFWYSVSQGKVYFCLTLTDFGFGNALLQYWTARAMAFYFQLDFAMDRNVCRSLLKEVNGSIILDVMDIFFFQQKASNWQNEIHSFHPSEVVLSNQFSHSVPFQTYQMDAATEEISDVKILANEWKQMMHKLVNMKTMSLKFPHASNSHLYLVVNKIFLSQIYQQEFRSLVKQQTKPLFLSDLDLVIHVRCGDILFLKNVTNLQSYGFMTCGYYYKVLNGVNYLNWFEEIQRQLEKKHNVSIGIHIISQLSTASVHFQTENDNINSCHSIVTALQNCIQNFIFQKFSQSDLRYLNLYWNIAKETTINQDFYKMILAPYLICSPSTFCLMAALANSQGRVMLPANFVMQSVQRLCPQTKVQNHYLMAEKEVNEFKLSLSQFKGQWSLQQIISYLSQH